MVESVKEFQAKIEPDKLYAAFASCAPHHCAVPYTPHIASPWSPRPIIPPKSHRPTPAQVALPDLALPTLALTALALSALALSALALSNLESRCTDREELGGRPYWLLRTKSAALTNKTIKVPGGNTIAKNQYYVEAQWYISSYNIDGCKKYRLLEEIVHVPVNTLIQDHKLEWEHEGRSGNESTLKEACHATLMQHNFSNVK
jgi:hypothetical protein